MLTQKKTRQQCIYKHKALYVLPKTLEWLPLLKQELPTIPEHLRSSRFLVGFALLNAYISALCFVYHCLSVCPFSFDHCVVCPSNYCFWLSLWYLEFCFWLSFGISNSASDYPSVSRILLLTTLRYLEFCFWLPLRYLEFRSGEVYFIQHYMIKFISDLWQVWPLAYPFVISSLSYSMWLANLLTWNIHDEGDSR